MKTVKEEIKFIEEETEAINTCIVAEQMFYLDEEEKIYGEGHKKKPSEEDADYLHMLGRILTTHCINYNIMLETCETIKSQTFESVEQLHDSKIYMQWYDVMTLCLLNSFQFREIKNNKHIDLLTDRVNELVKVVKILMKAAKSVEAKKS